MKKYLLISLASLLGACAAPFNSPIILAPVKVEQQQYLSINNVAINDSRQNKVLVHINGKPQNNQMTNLAVLSKTVKNTFITTLRGSKSVEFSVTDYGSYIDQQSVQFDIESILAWNVTITSKQGATWTKPFQTTLKQTGPLKANNDIVETHLNQLLETLLNRTLADAEFKKTLH